MSQKAGTVVGSSSSTRHGKSTVQIQKLAMVRCFHDVPAMYQTCKRPPNRGRKSYGCQFWKVNEECGFFKWEEDVKMNVIEKNKILEERLEDLVTEMDIMEIEVKNMKGGGSMGGINDDEDNHIINVIKENAELRSKIGKEKEKRKKVEKQVMAMKEELMALKVKDSNKCGGHMLWICLCFILFAIVLVKGK